MDGESLEGEVVEMDKDNDDQLEKEEYVSVAEESVRDA